MTGIEGAAGAAVAKVASDATLGALRMSKAQRQEEQRALLEAAKQTAGFKAAAELKGKKLAAKEAMGLIIMRPLANIMGVSRTYFETEFGQDYAAKIADVPDENLQTPKASIAGPAFEGLAYSLDEPKLKEMYLELLARASDDRVASSAHPSFVHIIGNLTSDEAVYLPAFIRNANRMTPIVEYRRIFEPSGTHGVMQSNILDIRNVDGSPLVDPMIPTYVDNWVRLKLVTVSYDTSLTADGSYDWELLRPERLISQKNLDEMRTPEFERIIQERGIDNVRLDAQRGIMISTDLGEKFAKAVGMAP
jgi:hypothetical protein